MKISDLKEYAIANKIPIISDEALAFIKQYIIENNVKNILEIGSAIGYSAICFASDNVHVDTVERDQVRVNEATKFISLFNANVTLYYADALEFSQKLGEYDLIFIDAAKAQYQRFFEKFQVNLAPNGTIICDNLNFHNLNLNEVSRNTRALIKKINRFKDFLANNKDYQTKFIQIGDGLSISKRI